MAKLFRIFHTGDCILTLELPDDYLTEKTSYTQSEFENTFNIFGRMLFDDLLNKDKKEFEIIPNDEGGYDYMFRST